MVVAPSRLRLAGLLSVLAGWPRKAAAVLCLALAVLSALSSRAAPTPESRSAVLVTTKPLPPGTVLAATDLTAVLWPDALVPVSAVRQLSDALGHTVGAAMSRGEPLTAARLLDTGISAALAPGQVALTIGLAGGDQAAILQAGALIDLYAAGTGALIGGDPSPAGGSLRLGSNLRVLAVVPPATAPAGDGASLVIAADRATAARLADRPAGPFLASLVSPS
ncbi:MAG: SAF domain-containing protein [Jatrophihabitantaceae bacterium]